MESYEKLGNVFEIDKKMRISSRTLSFLTEIIQYSFGKHNDIDLLIQKFDLQDEITSHTVKGKGREFVQLLRSKVQLGRLNEKVIIDLIEQVILRFQSVDQFVCPKVIKETYDRFCQTLALDGFVINENQKILPHTPEPASLAPELSRLEQNLGSCGLSIALTHYRHAYENLTDGRPEACNGSIRSFVENLIPEICKRITGGEFTNNPPLALQHLKQKGKIDGSEEGMFKNFWTHIQDEGPHQGLTTSSEAFYRLHMTTAIARYLMEKLISAV